MARNAATTAEMRDRDPSKRIGALAALAPFLKPYKGLMAAAAAALFLTAAVSLTLPLAVRRVIDNFGAENGEILDRYFMAALVITALLAIGTGPALCAGHEAGRARRGRHPPRRL